MKTSLKLGIIALFTFISLGTLTGCGNVSASNLDPNTLVFNLGADPKTLDPTRNSAVDGTIILLNTFEPLVTRDANNMIAPGAAERWEISEDGLTYTFYLREDGRWSDGEPVTARDFEYAWLRALSPLGEATHVTHLYYIENGEAFFKGEVDRDEVGIRVIDDYTIEITLMHPTSYFLETVAMSVYAPLREEIVEADPHGWALSPDTFISNGRYKMLEWNPQSNILLTRNEYHWDAENTLLENIDVKLVDDLVSGYASFRAGTFDIQLNVPQEQIQDGIESGDVIIYPQIGSYFFIFNADEEKAAGVNAEAAAAIQDVRVREALSLAINRYEIVDYVTMGGQQPAYSFVPPGSLNSDGSSFASVNYFPPEGDLERAQELLAEAGYPGGEGFPTLLLSYNTGGGHESISQAVQFMWQDGLGINVELQQADWAVFQDQRNNGEYIIARHGWVANMADPIYFLGLFESTSGNNNSFFYNEEYDALLAASRQESDPVRRDEILREAEDILMEEMPLIPFYYYTNPVAVHPHVDGLIVNPLGTVYFHEVVLNR